MKRLQIFLAGPAFVMAGGAAAQMAPQGMTPGQDYEANTQAPAQGTTPVDQMNEAPTTADPATDANFSDAQIESFAAAALKLRELQNDPATSEEQIAEVVAQSGIDVATFNAISMAIQSDPALAQRVQVAAQELQKSSG